MSDATPLDYADRCERYARQRGWAYDPARSSIGHLTPRQKRRALKKENGRWPAFPDDGAFYDDDDPLWGTDPHDLGYCVTPGCDCCDDPAGREIERRFLGDVTSWKPTGLSHPSQREEPS